MAEKPRVIELNDTEINAETIAAKLGLPVDDEEVKEMLAYLTRAVTNMGEEGTYLSLLVGMGRYLSHSLEGCRDVLGEVAQIEDREERERRAHAAVHYGLGLIIDFVDMLTRQMPCQRDKDEMPSGCTRH